MASIAQASEVRRLHRQRLMALPNVVGLGVGRKRTGGETQHAIALTVFVSRKVPLDELAEAERVPETIDGVATDVEVMEPLLAQQDQEGSERK